jgi:hypothetical protein
MHIQPSHMLQKSVLLLDDVKRKKKEKNQTCAIVHFLKRCGEGMRVRENKWCKMALHVTGVCF